MPSIKLSRSAQALGKTFTFDKTITSDGYAGTEPELAAAKVGTLATRSSDTAGTLNMNTGHGFTDGQVIDIYWSNGQCSKATIGTVATNSVPFTGATGDVLPLQGTAITAMVQHEESVAFLDANLKAVFVGAVTAACCVTFYDDADAVVGAVRVTAAPDGVSPQHFMWDDGNGVTIPVSDDVAKVGLTHGDSDNARVVSVLAMLN
jgi:hypothetical protein